MKSGGPWNLRGLRPETLRAARDAARRSGLSVGEWLNALIEDSEDQDRPTLADHSPDHDDAWFDEEGGGLYPGARARRRDYEFDDRRRGMRGTMVGRELIDVKDRLDQLTEQLEELVRDKPPLRGAPMRPSGRSSSRRRDLRSQPDAAVAADQPAADRSAAPDLPSPQTAPGLPEDSGESQRGMEFPQLEEQLRRITAQIEALRSTGLDRAIAAFRTDLADIRRQLTEALPRQAVESLCGEVEALARRIDRSREWTGDAAAIAGIERGLAEIRDALRGMTTAESLVGFDDALKALTQKLDLILAREDPAALRQLETAIGALRGIVSHVASNDALNKVAEDVRHLTAKIDGLAKGAASGQAVSALGSRIDNLTDALNASTQSAAPRGLEKLLSGVMEKLESLRLDATDPAFKRLEERIGQLIGRLDASDVRLGNLAAVERGVTDLLAHVEQLRSGETAPAASTSGRPAVAAIARDVAEIKRSEQRTQESLEAVHGTVEQVVGRLAMIESDIHDAALRGPRNPMPQEAGEKAPPGAATASPAATSPVSPELVAAAERQDFIAAARRATQAATATASDDDEMPSSSRRRRRSRSSAGGETQRSKPLSLRKLLVAVGIVVLTVSCLQIALHIFQESRPAGEAVRPWQNPADPVTQPDNNTAQPRSGALQPAGKPATVASNPLVPAPSEPMPLAAPVAAAAPDAAPGKSGAARNFDLPAPAEPAAQPLAVSSAAPSAMATPAAPQSGVTNADSTGSLPAPATAAIAAAPLPPPNSASAATNSPEVSPDTLPAAIGGPALRAAAIAGDMAAQYEIGVRFGEGHGVPRDERQAAHWLELAAKQGLAPAQFRLGGYYEKGIGVKKDLTAARELYLAAAAKGNAKAMHNLAVLYADGVNGRSDYHAAALWFHKAADRGVIDSQFNLATLYARGSGEPQNYAEAYKWFALAAKTGDVEAASKRDEIAEKLDEATLAAANLVVRSWKPEPQPEEAIKVKTPPGGWDGAAQPAKPKPRTKSANLGGSDSRTN